MPTRSRMATTLLVGLVIGLSACAPSQPGTEPGAVPAQSLEPDSAPASASSPATEADRPQLVLVGMAGFPLEDFSLELQDLGYEVSEDARVSPETDLVLVVVNAPDGPMPPTRDGIAALAGSVVPRVAIALTQVDKVLDPELETLVVRDTVDLLAGYGIDPVDSQYVVRSPGRDIASVIERHLRRAPRDYRPALPTTPAPPSGPVSVDHFAGIPMTYALEMLASKGLVGEVLADPDFGVVSDCNPSVMDQTPAAGTMLAPGATVAILVSPPDKGDPAMAGCLLPERTREEIDARRAELAAQPSP